MGKERNQLSLVMKLGLNILIVESIYQLLESIQKEVKDLSKFY
jgi:prefoldin subunit 5